MIGANRNTKPSNTKNTEEKFSLELINRKRFLKSKHNGINKMKSRTENEASKRLKLRKVKADEGLLKSKLK